MYGADTAKRLMPPKKKPADDAMGDEGQGPPAPSDGDGDEGGGGKAEIPNTAEKQRAEQLVAEIPHPDEPLSGPTVHMFGLQLGKAVEALSGGQVPAPPPPTEPSPDGSLPPELYIVGKTVSAAMESGPLADAKYAPYKFDMQEAASSSAGLADAAAKLGGLAKMGPPKMGGAPKPPPAAAPPDEEESPPTSAGTAKRLMPPIKG